MPWSTVRSLHPSAKWVGTCVRVRSRRQHDRGQPDREPRPTRRRPPGQARPDPTGAGRASRHLPGGRVPRRGRRVRSRASARHPAGRDVQGRAPRAGGRHHLSDGQGRPAAGGGRPLHRGRAPAGPARRRPRLDRARARSTRPWPRSCSSGGARRWVSWPTRASGPPRARTPSARRSNRSATRWPGSGPDPRPRTRRAGRLRVWSNAISGCQPVALCSLVGIAAQHRHVDRALERRVLLEAHGPVAPSTRAGRRAR